jgi:AcrR family transcriptional regulator
VTALELFNSQGFAETTFDQIADAAEISRRTIFDYFPTKEAILFDHLMVRHEVALESLRSRPATESTSRSLYEVFRSLCEHGYDRAFLALIRTVLRAEPQLAYAQLSVNTRQFERELISTLEARRGLGWSLEVRTTTLIALSWLDSAVRAYLLEGNRSLLDYFDEAVSICRRMMSEDLLPPPS